MADVRQELDSHRVKLMPAVRLRRIICKKLANIHAVSQLRCSNRSIISDISWCTLFWTSTGCQLHFSALRLKLAFLEPVQKCPHRRVWSAESGVQAIVETLGQVGCPRSTMVKMSPHGRRKFASDPSILEILRQRLSPCVEVGTAHWRNLQYVPYDRDAKRWKQAH